MGEGVKPKWHQGIHRSGELGQKGTGSFRLKQASEAGRTASGTEKPTISPDGNKI